MRPLWIATVPVLAALSAAPVAGQVSARVHVDIPIGRPSATYAQPGRRIAIREYDPYRFGGWDSYFDQWLPETVYYWDGYYYDYPIVAYAEPILVYRFRNELFFAPRQREFITWREQYRGRNDRRDFGREFRPAPRNDRDDRGGRDVRPVQPQRNDRNGRDVQPVQPQRDGRNARPAPAAPRDDRNARPAPAPARDGNRSRPRGGH